MIKGISSGLIVGRDVGAPPPPSDSMFPPPPSSPIKPSIHSPFWKEDERELKQQQQAMATMIQSVW